MNPHSGDSSTTSLKAKGFGGTADFQEDPSRGGGDGRGRGRGDGGRRGRGIGISYGGSRSKNADKKNAFVKHSLNKHPEHLRDPSIFEFKVNSTFKSCLDRQVREGVNIASDKSDELMNSKTEYHQPSITRVTTTREVDVMRSQGS